MDHIEPKKVYPSLYTASVEAIIQLWVEFQIKYYCSFAVRNLTFISCRLIRFHNTFKTPKKPLLSKLQQKSFSMASKRGQKRPKTKVTKMSQFWNLIINVICEDCKNAKIIKRFLLGEALLTLKFSFYTTVGSMLFWLTLHHDLFWGQIEFGQLTLGLNISKRVWTMPF